ncbi:hypothetical protein ACWD5A_39715, partial [Streptomyces sp. NPDC002491]
ARHRAVRRRVLYAVAASVVVALAGPVIAMMAGGGSGDGGTDAVRLTATDEKSGVWAQITTENEAWGSHVQLEVKDGAGPRACRLIAVGVDGSEQTVTSWTVPLHDARPNTMQGAAAWHPEEIARYELRTAGGEHLVTLPAR